MTNPSIEELKNSEEFELIAELHHSQIKDFVISHYTENHWMTKFYMYYQVVMVVLGIYILTQDIFFAIRGVPESLFYGFASLVLSFTFLIPIHELLHGLAIKLCGAPKVNYGAYLSKFIFYAEADRFVLNRQQFTRIALAPLVVIQLITLIGLMISRSSVLVSFWLILMSVHSLFCAGDIGLLSVFYREGNPEVFTFDVKSEKKSYYYQRKSSLQKS